MKKNKQKKKPTRAPNDELRECCVGRISFSASQDVHKGRLSSEKTRGNFRWEM